MNLRFHPRYNRLRCPVQILQEHPPRNHRIHPVLNQVRIRRSRRVVSHLVVLQVFRPPNHRHSPLRFPLQGLPLFQVVSPLSALPPFQQHFQVGIQPLNQAHNRRWFHQQFLRSSQLPLRVCDQAVSQVLCPLPCQALFLPLLHLVNHHPCQLECQVVDQVVNQLLVHLPSLH